MYNFLEQRFKAIKAELKELSAYCDVEDIVDELDKLHTDVDGVCSDLSEREKELSDAEDLSNSDDSDLSSELESRGYKVIECPSMNDEMRIDKLLESIEKNPYRPMP